MIVYLRALFFALLLAPNWASAQTAEKLPYPQYYSTLTNDFADILTDEAEARINAELLAAREQKGLEMTVVTIRSRDDYAPSSGIESFAKTLFNGWGIGNKERNDGILLLVAIEDRELRIALGAGYPARQDGIAARIIQTEIVPAFQDGRVADGIFNGTRAAIERLTAQQVAPQTTAPAIQTPAPVTQEEPFAPRETGIFARIRALFAQFSGSVLDTPFVGFILAIATVVLGFFGIRFGQRHRPRKCPQCGRLMLRLGEAQEDQYLDHGQLVEERLNSKDYGVWFCTEDEHVTVMGYPKLFKKHTACPNCQYHTYETTRTVMMHATTTSYGQARLDHECQNCGHKDSEIKVIAKVAQSSTGGSRSSGSSSSSSGFSGGGSSGGGASGKW